MNTETTDTPAQPAQGHRRYEAHYDDAGSIVWTVIQEPVTFKPEPPTESPVLNRAQRRQLQRTIARKARTQVRLVARRHGLMNPGPRCPRCNLYFLGSSAARCQCQLRHRRECALCHEIYMASPQERRYANVCAACGAIIEQQWQNGQDRAGEAQQRWYEQRAWEDEQHRAAQEAMNG